MPRHARKSMFIKREGGDRDEETWLGEGVLAESGSPKQARKKVVPSSSSSSPAKAVACRREAGEKGAGHRKAGR